MQCDLVLEGGGAKGAAYVGALRVLEQRGYRVRRGVGTSAGAIALVGIAIGLCAEQVNDLLCEKDFAGKSVFESFMDAPSESAFSEEEIQQSTLFKLFQGIDLPLVPDAWESSVDAKIFGALNQSEIFRMLFSLEERGGLFEGNAFLTWLRSVLARSGINPESTLAELYARTGFDLNMVCVDSTTGLKIVLNHRTAPALPVVWATRCTMSIPFLWQEVLWRSEWGSYLGQDIHGHAIIDGGVASNFALDLFLDSSDPLVQEVMGCEPASDTAVGCEPASDTAVGQVPVFGLLIDESLAVPNEPELISDDAWTSLQTVSRVKRLVDAMRNATDNAYMRLYARNVCRLPAKGYKTTEFEMSDSRRNSLIGAAEQATKNFLLGFEMK